MSQNLLNLLKNASSVFAGVGLHHYASRLLDYTNKRMAAKAEPIRDNKVDEILTGIKTVRKSLDDLATKVSNQESGASVVANDEIIVYVNRITEEGENVKKFLNQDVNTEEAKVAASKSLDVVVNCANKIAEILEDLSKGNKSFISVFDSIRVYLDSLSLLEESAIVHIAIFIAILVTLFNILSVFFGNELIKYFNLENKFSSLATFFKLRYTFQRYYLLWNIFFLFILCLSGIFVNILVLGLRY